MPAPIAHIGQGYGNYPSRKHRLPQERKGFWKFPLQMLLVIGLSMLPVFDVIPVIPFSDMHRYHSDFAQTLSFAIPITFLGASLYHRIHRSNFWLSFLIGASLVTMSSFARRGNRADRFRSTER